MGLELDPRAPEPLFRQISRAIAGRIQSGALKPGTTLPGSRTLAAALAVHRNTVLAAYAELLAEGWAETSPARGTFVSRSLPVVRPKRFTARPALREAVPRRTGFDLRHRPEHRPTMPVAPGTLLMTGGVPDVRLLPIAELAQAYRHALRRDAPAALGYVSPWGHMRLREALAAQLSATRALAARPEDVLVTRGSQMALDLAARALLQPGDIVAVENPGYRYAWEVFRQHGAKVVPIPVDEGGLDVEALEALARRTPIRAVYTTPHHQYPTTVTLTAGRRIALLDLAARLRFAIVEDDYDHEFHYDGRPVLPLASADREGNVVYVGTLAKILAPGLRLGYLVAPPPLLERIAAQREHVDRCGDHVLESAVAQLLESGVVQRHVRRARRIYHARRDFLVRELRTELPDVLDFAVPGGGLALWAKVGRGVDIAAWVAGALERGVLIHGAGRYSFDGNAGRYVRLGFAALDETELRQAVRRLKEALPAQPRKPAGRRLAGG